MLDPENPDQPISFSAFLGRLEDGLIYHDLHWRPQAHFIPNGGRDFNFIGRVEKLDEQLPQVMKHIFGRFDGLAIKQGSRTGSSKDAKSAISPGDMRRIERLYEDDYEMLETLNNTTLPKQD